MTIFYQILASLGGASGVGFALKTGLAWLSRQARREGKLDQILAELTAITADHETRIRALETAGKARP